MSLGAIPVICKHVISSFSSETGFAFLAAALLLAFWYWFAEEWQENHQQEEAFHRQSVLNQLLPHQKAIFLNFNNWTYDFHGYYFRKLYDMPMPESWWRLSSSSQPRRCQRTAEDTLEIEVIQESQTGETGPTSPDKNHVIRLRGLRITVLETGPMGPTRVEFKFDRSLDDDIYH